MRKRMIWIAPLAILGVVVFITLGGLLVMYLWNWLAPMLFGWRVITFWQALALLVLCRILFGGFRMGGGGARSRIRARMAERWDKMTPEEREMCRQRFYGRWGGPPPPESKPTA